MNLFDSKVYLNPLETELIFRHARVDRLPAHSRSAHRDLKFSFLPKFERELMGPSGR